VISLIQISAAPLTTIASAVSAPVIVFVAPGADCAAQKTPGVATIGH
jgi:hypothetical protein